METLPPGKTETGMWQGGEGLGVDFGPTTLSVISFPVRLAQKPTALLLLAEEPTPAEEVKCPGSAEHPEAAPGVFCMYDSSGLPELENGGLNAFTVGVQVFLTNNEFGPSTGTWAVTAEN